MNFQVKHAVGIGAALLAILASITLLSYMQGFQQVLLMENLLSGTSPTGVLAVFGILIFGGVYFFNIAGKIIKQSVK